MHDMCAARVFGRTLRVNADSRISTTGKIQNSWQESSSSRFNLTPNIAELKVAIVNTSAGHSYIARF